MTSIYMPPPPAPCVRCKTRLVKGGGITGMCVQCRHDDPVMADQRRTEHAQLKAALAAEMGKWLDENTIPDPFGRPGVRMAKGHPATKAKHRARLNNVRF
jgi:hypothetical protein